jgi:hypothetical protein
MIMWSNRVSPAIAAIIAIAVAIAFTLATEVWYQMPNRSFGRACQDNIERIYGDLRVATCDPNQSLAYMRDLSGERFIVCRCRSGESPEDGLQPEFPELPTLIWEDNDDDEKQPVTSEQPKHWAL